MDRLKIHAPKVLRIGIALIIMWFGFQQLLNPSMWTGFLPDFVKLFPISPITFVYLNGWFEVFASLLMMIGLFIRTTSCLIAIHLIGIVFSLGYNAIAMRDLGLTIALVTIFLSGADDWSVDSTLNK